jgi:hypothetical protein
LNRKIFQEFANTLCHMLVGWRMWEDLEILAGLPDGTLTVDVLSGTSTQTHSGNIDLHIAKELQAWLVFRLEQLQIPISALHTVQVVANIRTDRIPTIRASVVSFDFSIDSIIKTADRSYNGKLIETHRWYNRVASNYAIKGTSV